MSKETDHCSPRFTPTSSHMNAPHTWSISVASWTTTRPWTHRCGLTAFPVSAALCPQTLSPAPTSPALVSSHLPLARRRPLTYFSMTASLSHFVHATRIQGSPRDVFSYSTRPLSHTFIFVLSANHSLDPTPIVLLYLCTPSHLKLPPLLLHQPPLSKYSPFEAELCCLFSQTLQDKSLSSHIWAEGGESTDKIDGPKKNSG